MIAEVENDEIISLLPDRDHPVTKGFACHKGLATLEIHQDPDRNNYPMKKVGNGFERVSWDEAAAGIAEGLASVREKYGANSIASYTGNPLAFNSMAGPAIGSFFGSEIVGRLGWGFGAEWCSPPDSRQGHGSFRLVELPGGGSGALQLGRRDPRVRAAGGTMGPRFLPHVQGGVARAGSGARTREGE